MRLITVSEASPILHMSQQAIWTLVREEVIPSGVVVRLGRRIRFNETKLIAWLDAGGQGLPGGWKWEATAAKA